MGIEPTSLGHLLQSTATCYVPWTFTIDRHVNPLVAFGATSTTIEPFAGDVSILVGQPPIGFHQLMNPLELPLGIEPSYPDYKSGASPAMLWEQL